MKYKRFFYALPLLGTLFFHMACESVVIPILAPTLASPTGVYDMMSGYSAQTHKIFYGITLAIYPVAIFFLAPIIGALSDTLGRRPVLLISILGAIIGCVMQGLAMEFMCIWTFLIGRLIVGATAGVDGAVQAALLDKCTTPAQKNFYLGLSLFAMSVGFIAGLAFASMLIDENATLFAWSLPFFVMAIAFVAVWGTLYKTMPRDNVKKLKFFSVDWFGGLRDIASLRKSKKSRILLSVYSAAMVASGCFSAVLPLVLAQTYDFGVKKVAFFMTMQGVGGAVMFAFLGPLMLKIFKKRSVLLFAIVMCMYSVVLPLFKETDWAIWTLTLSNALGFLLTYYVILSMFSESTPESRKGWILSVLTSFWGLMVGVGLMVCGALATFSNSTVLYASIILVGISLILSLYFWRLLKPAKEV